MTTVNPKLPYWHHQLVLSWYHHQPESHQQSLNQRSCSDRQTPGPIDRTPETPGSGKNGISWTLSLTEFSSRTEIFRTGVDFAFPVSGVVGFDPSWKEEAFLLSVANSNSSVAAPPSCLQCGC